MSVLGALALLALGDGNRLWWLEVEARGPLAEFTLDCGADGTTRVRGPFLAGERRLTVPVPARVPLGLEGLSAAALPRAREEGVRVLGWSAEQPEAAFAREARSLLARGRPPVESAPARSGRAEALLALCLLPLLVRLRRRAAGAAALALLAGGFLLWRSAQARPGAHAVELLEADLASGRALLVRGAHGALNLGRTRLEARPDGVALAFDLVADGSAGEVRADGAGLFQLEPWALPALAPTGSDESLEAVWVRTARGEWSAHGPWRRGTPLPAVVPGGVAPPGWLTGALPPGVGILVARRAGGGWLRATGFELPREESQNGY